MLLRTVPQGLRPFGYAKTLHQCSTCLLAVFLILLVGCAQPQRTPASSHQTLWTGRLALQVEDQTSQSFSASFELSGSALEGQLLLLTPLGSSLARLQWSAGHAEIKTGQDTRESTSLETLLRNLLGTEIPIAALFSWLEGEQVSAAGWHVDLSAIANGRLVAKRSTPAPQATLRIVLTR